MASNLEPTPPADTHGDWKSRKAKLTVISLAVPWMTATVGWLALGKMDAGAWVSFNQWVIPLVLAVYSGANVLEKIGARRKA